MYVIWTQTCYIQILHMYISILIVGILTYSIHIDTFYEYKRRDSPRYSSLATSVPF